MNLVAGFVLTAGTPQSVRSLLSIPKRSLVSKATTCSAICSVAEYAASTHDYVQTTVARSIRLQSIRMNTQIFFDQVAGELMTSPPHPGLWARAYATADGDLAKARARYILLRVEQLEAAHREALKADCIHQRSDSPPAAPAPSETIESRVWPYLTEEESITELSRFGRRVTKTAKASWLVSADGQPDQRASSLYDLQKLIAVLRQQAQSPTTGAA
jgi:hypothetical protein